MTVLKKISPWCMPVPTFDGSIGCGAMVLITGFGIPLLNTWLEAPSEWNGNELWSSVLEVDRIGAEESEVDPVFLNDLVRLRVDGKTGNIPVGLAVKTKDTDADVSDNDDDDDNGDDSGNNGDGDFDNGGSDIEEGADGDGVLATATTELALE